MPDDIMVRQLHDQATRGGTLTSTEQATLQTWYDQQDATEAAQITASQTRLRDITAILEQMQHQYNALLEENHSLLQEQWHLLQLLQQNGTTN